MSIVKTFLKRTKNVLVLIAIGGEMWYNRSRRYQEAKGGEDLEDSFL
jgi:hypothetical protein